MAQFVQPQNREADLKAILEGYEGRIGHQYWLSEACQKDGIQNCWDAKQGKRGKDWSCVLFYREFKGGSPPVFGFEDRGTFGLTGTIPRNREEAVSALLTKNPEERLAYFLSQDWSEKEKTALGSRGRGKMIFIGASKDKEMFFDSLRSSDKVYIFGKTFIDKNKSISVMVFSGDEAEKGRKEAFGDYFGPLDHYGTRIFIPNPKEELVEAFQGKFTERQIQYTWWEILHKYNAKIELDNKGWKKRIELSPWMPVSKLGLKETESTELISLPKDGNLRVKKASFCYLGDKEVPESYRGLVIQRSGMVVERIPVSRLIGENIGEKIIGSVELGEKLEAVIRDNEGPEHYNIFWNRSIPSQLRAILKGKTISFARKYRLIEEKKKHASREQRMAEVAVQKELNELAKKLGFSYGSEVAPRDRKKGKRKLDEKIRLSIADFSTPYENGRVDTGQSVKGTYAVPISEFNEPLNVLIRVWIYHKDAVIKKDGKDLIIEEEMPLPAKKDVRVGWNELKIDKSFEPGKYSFRAKMVAMENKNLNSTLEVEKGKEIYGPVSRTFYVNEDPKEKGIFKYEMVIQDDKSKYFWWSYEDKTWIIYYNGVHPVFKPVIDDPDLLKEELRKIGVLVAFAIVCSKDAQLIGENSKPKVFSRSDLTEASFEELLRLIINRQSKILWEKSGG